ncbi:fibronectin type III domain-containing protein [Actinoplanes sp. TRM 88003]|uniref:Fibronectin type III domain-containing protein n=1 Tax=Paractinoplanes aksuensis TaxID=2939490 RepID=A0ABT1DQF6_9ACTN|nr:fibronectin type III domain-containing protein [Actinoplanes aksuensis]MCO8273069.1 fibronectin type III domain-containing protein [Actinoplanes aksuensis]
MRRRRLELVVLAPLLLAGCGSDDKASTTEDQGGGKSWVVVETGSPTTSAAPSRPTGTRSPFPSGFLPLPAGTPTPTPTGTPACPPVKGNVINGADVTTGATSGAVTWYDPATADIVEYRITAISQDSKLGPQRDIGWTVVTPGATCGYRTATVTGLDRGTRYVFSVDMVTSRKGYGNDGTVAATVARSGVVKTS